MTTFTDDSDTMGAVREILEPRFLALSPPIKYKKQRNAGIDKDTPCVIVSRAGGNGLESLQGVILRDQPVLVMDIYTTNIDDAHVYATKIEKVMKSLGATKLTGQVPVPAAVESSSIRAVSVSFQMTIK
jgi:hypothetical protein